MLARTRASRLDDLVTMLVLVRFIGRIEAKARADLEAWHRERRVNVTELFYDLIDALPLGASPAATGILDAISDLLDCYFPPAA